MAIKKRVHRRSRRNHQHRVFISYSHHDRDKAKAIADKLRENGHEVWIDSLQLKPGDNISERINEGLATADAIVFVISKYSLHSPWVQREFSAIALQQISKREQRIVPVRLDESEVPSYFADRLYIDCFPDFDRGLAQLVEALRVATPKALEAATTRTSSSETRDSQVSKLRDCLSFDRLTLFCGAGASVGAGIPTWDSLLIKLLESMMDKISQKQSLDLSPEAAMEFQRRNGLSPLILGKYLKNNLGRDFAKEVRDALYLSKPTSCPLIDGIVTLSRPQRSSRPLDSIVTFNFDGLIEENLLDASIPNKAICSETIDHSPNEMPIYHVHGYLPRNGAIDAQTEIVFSEDAFHSQFIDPFSWSNLIQLNKLTQSTCLFVGISLTDPNMRRLLDVAWRKNSQQRLGHYIVKRRPKSQGSDDVIDKVSQFLEEQDANGLGLNVIWVDHYDELPLLLGEIANPVS